MILSIDLDALNESDVRSLIADLFLELAKKSGNSITQEIEGCALGNRVVNVMAGGEATYESTIERFAVTEKS